MRLEVTRFTVHSCTLASFSSQSSFSSAT